MGLEGNAAASPSSSSLKRKLVAVGAFLIGKSFNTSKCKTEMKLAIARIKLLRNRREVQITQMRRDIAMLLSSGKDPTARIRVEHVIREQNIMAANDIIELFCELMVLRLSIVAKQRDCPLDLKEGISSLLFAGPRCSEIPELVRIRDLFEKKYGKDFVCAAIELRSNSGVNRTLIEKLSVKTPPGEVKLKVMKEIARDFHVEWDPRETEEELLRLPEKGLNGPSTFVSASSMPIKPGIQQQDAPINTKECRHCDEEKCKSEDMGCTISASKAAVELAEKAAEVAQAAADLAKQTSGATDNSGSKSELPSKNGNSWPSTTTSMENGDFQRTSSAFSGEKNVVASGDHQECRKNRRNERWLDSDIKFDDSDGVESDYNDESDEQSYHVNEVGHQPPNRPAPKLPPPPSNDAADNMDDTKSKPSPTSSAQVHPNLPDYDSLAARFEALKVRRFS